MPNLTEEDWNRIIAKKGLKRYLPNTLGRLMLDGIYSRDNPLLI